MDGFTRLLVSKFDAYNAAALARIIAVDNDASLEQYTYTLPDTDPLYCWARQEPLFTDLMTNAEFDTVISLEDAISQGMIINSGII